MRETCELQSVNGANISDVNNSGLEILMTSQPVTSLTPVARAVSSPEQKLCAGVSGICA